MHYYSWDAQPRNWLKIGKIVTFHYVLDLYIIVIFDANKILIVGMTSNSKAQKEFETKMKRHFTNRGVDAMRSLDVFDIKFTDAQRSEEELDEVEQSLLDKDFDAILFTKILGSENRESFRREMIDLNRYHDSFKNDYLSHQDIYTVSVLARNASSFGEVL